ncbi:hypothetical protein QJS04_geneDACA000146 [Acorus gramineus]|uniref:HMA domain-containing protein n=1 Tax=Acorus gramineus TaxID=55184 RepID=A0AAV9APN6_ACOGR|nr:hypothetical protein QJS04_geneDACA024406 [Acorus gramineus]KAK1266042.1 hypothetical protein QJS04_geneDACA000146 [Acorus gramineus]
MASISAFTSISPTYSTNSRCISSYRKATSPSPSLFHSGSRSFTSSSPRTRRRDPKKIRAFEGEETLIPVEGSVPVSPSDFLTMFFKETEGVSEVKVQIVEEIASVELAKQTTVQATGVASSLVEIIQGAGFKLQTLNLSFEDEEDKTN